MTHRRGLAGRRRRRTALFAVLGGLLAGAFLAGAPAQAHRADAPAGTDYRVTVTSVTPEVPDLTVRAIEAGAQLELTNRTGRTIEVLGYAGEPYLRIGPDGVFENLNSPATAPWPVTSSRPPRRTPPVPRFGSGPARSRSLAGTISAPCGPNRDDRPSSWPIRAANTESANGWSRCATATAS
jgi:hypothetical protein